MLKHVRRATLALTTTAALAASLVAAPTQAATPQASSSAGWLAGQLTNGIAHNDQYDIDDYGLSLDIWFALDALDVRAGTRSDILDALESKIADYTTYNGTTYSGPVGKLLAAVETAGIDPATYGDGSLLPTLRSLVVTSGPETGRAKDDDAGGADYSNTIGQSYSVRALSLADDDLKSSTTTYLLKQQCPKGFFRESMGTADDGDFSCASGRSAGTSSPSVDATAFAVMALRVARAHGVDGVDDDIKDAVTWLKAKQHKDGSFTGNGEPNSNTTGLAAAVLAGPAPKAAAKAARWLDGLRVTKKLASDGALGGEAGAVAYDRKAFRDAVQNGIGNDRDQWRRATAQAAVGLDALP